jgi:hypothetical protein
MILVLDEYERRLVLMRLEAEGFTNTAKALSEVFSSLDYGTKFHVQDNLSLSKVSAVNNSPSVN